MTFELLVSCVRKDAHELAQKMNIASDAVIVSQLEEKTSEEYFDIGDKKIHSIKSRTKGVGLNRNTCIEQSKADIILFADEDIVYVPDYETLVVKEFEAHQEADMILFNVKVCEERRTYWNEGFKKVGLLNCGRYPAYSIAARSEALKASGVRFSLLFGGGAKFSNGEDSLFLSDCLKKGLKIFSDDVVIGEEIPRPSTWFFGYTDKYFYDRGVLYHFLYGRSAKLLGIRWLMKTKKDYIEKYPYGKAKKMLFAGVKDGASGDVSFDEKGKLIRKQERI